MNYQPAPAANPANPKPGPQQLPDSDRHSRKCLICSHPDRDTIDRCFLHWHCPQNIASEFGVPLASIYRHAHATGLFSRRSCNLRRSLEFIIERAERSLPSADAIVRAVRAYAHINDDGRWVDPPKQVVITNRQEQIPAQPQPSEPAHPSSLVPADSAAQIEDSYGPLPQTPPPVGDWSHSFNSDMEETGGQGLPPLSQQPDEFLIVNEKIRNSPQPTQNPPHSEFLIVNKPPVSPHPTDPQNPLRTSASSGGFAQ